jgi:hypothetical protein
MAACADDYGVEKKRTKPDGSINHQKGQQSARALEKLHLSGRMTPSKTYLH